MRHSRLAGMGLWETLLGCQPGIGSEGGLGGMGCVFSPVKDRAPFQPVHPSAQRLPWDGSQLPSLQYSQTLPLLPCPPSPPHLPVPSSRQLLLCVTPHPALLSKYFSDLSQAMAVSLAFFLAVLAIPRLKHHHLISVAMAQQMWQREESLHQDKVAAAGCWAGFFPGLSVEEAELSVWQQWPFWTRKMKLGSNSCHD